MQPRDITSADLTLWGWRETQLPIDCQIQAFSEQKDIDGPRNALPRTFVTEVRHPLSWEASVTEGARHG